MNKLLIVDDDKSICQTLELHLTGQGFDVSIAHRVEHARKVWPEWSPDVVLLDLKLPDGNGIALLGEAKKLQWSGNVIIITGFQDMSSTIEAMKLGAYDFVIKPLNIDNLDLTIQKAVDIARLSEQVKALSREHTGDLKPDDIVGASPAIYKVIKHIGLAANTQVTVLLRGESGTGKELVARVIHRSSSPEQPFVAINCGAMVETLLESELFGHEKGAFTGADTRKIGKLEFAGSGTVFLDEIAELSFNLQAKLLRVIQEREFERVGGLRAIPLQARIITASNQNLPQLIKNGEFREDLFYRLEVFSIELPPLRNRREDIPLLVHHLLNNINRELHRKITKVSGKDMKYLATYDWPGNVRELHNVLTRAAVLTKGDVLDLSELHASPKFLGETGEKQLLSLKELEKRHIERVLLHTDGNYGEACDILGITRPTLRKKMEDYGLKNRF